MTEYLCLAVPKIKSNDIARVFFTNQYPRDLQVSVQDATSFTIGKLVTQGRENWSANILLMGSCSAVLLDIGRNLRDKNAKGSDILVSGIRSLFASHEIAEVRLLAHCYTESLRTERIAASEKTYLLDDLGDQLSHLELDVVHVIARSNPDAVVKRHSKG